VAAAKAEQKRADDEANGKALSDAVARAKADQKKADDEANGKAVADAVAKATAAQKQAEQDLIAQKELLSKTQKELVMFKEVNKFRKQEDERNIRLFKDLEAKRAAAESKVAKLQEALDGQAKVLSDAVAAAKADQKKADDAANGKALADAVARAKAELDTAIAAERAKAEESLEKSLQDLKTLTDEYWKNELDARQAAILKAQQAAQAKALLEQKQVFEGTLASLRGQIDDLKRASESAQQQHQQELATRDASHAKALSELNLAAEAELAARQKAAEVAQAKALADAAATAKAELDKAIAAERSKAEKSLEKSLQDLKTLTDEYWKNELEARQAATLKAQQELDASGATAKAMRARIADLEARLAAAEKAKAQPAAPAAQPSDELQKAIAAQQQAEQDVKAQKELLAKTQKELDMFKEVNKWRKQEDDRNLRLFKDIEAKRAAAESRAAKAEENAADIQRRAAAREEEIKADMQALEDYAAANAEYIAENPAERANKAKLEADRDALAARLAEVQRQAADREKQIRGDLEQLDVLKEAILENKGTVRQEREAAARLEAERDALAARLAEVQRQAEEDLAALNARHEAELIKETFRAYEVQKANSDREWEQRMEATLRTERAINRAQLEEMTGQHGFFQRQQNNK
jgi:hypothetical protein